MAITNIFRTGGGGSGGFQFPAEKIILSIKDLTSEGYMSMNVDIILLKDEAPKLWEIYNTGADLFTIKALIAEGSDKSFWIFIE